MSRIGMVVATQKEIVPFLKAQNIEVYTYKNKGFDVMEFKMGENEIVCVRSGVGEIYAAAATQLIISEYKVDVMMNFGVCGTLTGKIGVFNVVLIKGVTHYDFDLSGIDGLPVGKYPDEEIIIKTDGNLRKIARDFMPWLEEVVCASADKFVSDEKTKMYLSETFGAEVCDMESAAVLLTSKNAGVPCLVIKAVSDGGGAEEYYKMVHGATEKYVELIKGICDRL